MHAPYPIEPVSKLRGFPERVQRAVGFQEDFLGHVPGVLKVPEPLIRQRVDSVLVSEHQLLERLLVRRAGSMDELGIGWFHRRVLCPISCRRWPGSIF